MIKYPTPAVATDRPRYFALIVVARIVFWLAVFVAFSCLVITLLIQEILGGGANGSVSTEGALLAVTFALVAVPFIASGVASVLFVLGALAAGMLAAMDKTAVPLRVFYVVSLPVFVFAAIFFFQISSRI